MCMDSKIRKICFSLYKIERKNRAPDFSFVFSKGKNKFSEFCNPCTSKCVTYEFSKLFDYLQIFFKMLFMFSSYPEKCSKRPRSAANNIKKFITIFWQRMSARGESTYMEKEKLLEKLQSDNLFYLSQPLAGFQNTSR